MRTDPQLPAVFTTAGALAQGLTGHMVDARVAGGRWRRLRRGVYCTASTWNAADARGRHVLKARAAVLSRAAEGVISHVSAAAVHGWPLPLDVPTDVFLTAASLDEPTRRLDGLVVQVAGLPAGDVTRRRGLVLTSPARTVADCLRHLPAADAVAIADHALAQGDVDPAALADAIRRQEAWPYAAAAARALPLIDSRRESWLESWSFVRLWERGIELPEPQVWVYDESGRFVARVDGLWRRYGTVCEADGRGKYLQLLDDGPPDPKRIAAAVLKEKKREDALRGTGLEVVRWDTREITRHLPEVVRRVHETWRRGDPRRFRGSFRVEPRLELTQTRLFGPEPAPQPGFGEQTGAG